MVVRKFLELSTSHLSPGARAWLSEGAKRNHDANRGAGRGFSLGTLGATLYGWFMHAPAPPKRGDAGYGMPADLLTIIKRAHAEGCDYISFDADADVLAGLALYNDSQATAAAKPMAFEYFEIRPCIESDDGIDNFRDEEEFAARVAALPEGARAFWTLYGIDPEGIGIAIGDFTTKADAHEIMNAILAPMAAARDTLDAGSRFTAHEADLLGRIDAASSLLEDFINQCSNMERV